MFLYLKRKRVNRRFLWENTRTSSLSPGSMGPTWYDVTSFAFRTACGFSLIPWEWIVKISALSGAVQARMSFLPPGVDAILIVDMGIGIPVHAKGERVVRRIRKPSGGRLEKIKLDADPDVIPYEIFHDIVRGAEMIIQPEGADVEVSVP